MRVQLVCVVLLALASCSLCSDSEEEMKTLEADLLTNMYTSKEFNHRAGIGTWGHDCENTNLILTFLATNDGSGVIDKFEDELIYNVRYCYKQNLKQTKINRAKLPYWKMTLLNVCNLVNNINNQMGETVEVDEEDLVPGRQFPAALDGFSLEAMLTVYQLQKVCHSRAFQHWELLQQDSFDLENTSQEKEIMKRKNPYILKRQLHVSKARRPYILKRSSYY